MPLRFQGYIQPRNHPLPPLERAVFGLDRWLRHRQGVFEFTTDPNCMFRVQRARAAEHLTLFDGTSIVPGSPILDLHLWNEHMPAMTGDGPTIGWARHVSHRIETSLRDLVHYFKQRSDLDDVVAVRADMCLGTSEQSAQLIRLSGRYGFEAVLGTAAASATSPLQALHHIGQNVFIFLLVLATNPVAARVPVLRRNHALAYLSRATLESRFNGMSGYHGLSSLTH